MAILATKGGCSIEEKALVASTLIRPENIVSYLIVEDDKERSDLAEPYDQESDETLQFPEASNWMPRLLRKRNDNIKVAILKVSAHTVLSLLQVVRLETIITIQNGGTKVVLNSKVPNENARNIFVWTAVSMACFCCSCFFLAVCYQQGAFGQELPNEAAPQRPVRRRLTVQQVRENYPSFHFHPPEDDVSNDQKNDGLLVGGNEECSICLDEYVPGVRLRQLPCQHVFHSTCICRWLVERHAVCPLCKIDLYEEEEEDSSSSSGEEAVEAAAPPQESEATARSDESSWWSTWPFTSSPSAAGTSTGSSWGRLWSSRRRRRGDSGMLTELTEPLIPSGGADGEGQSPEEAAIAEEGSEGEEARPTEAQEAQPEDPPTSEEQTSTSTPVEV